MHVPIFLDLSMTNIVRIRKVTFPCFHMIQRKSGVSLFSVAFFFTKSNAGSNSFTVSQSLKIHDISSLLCTAVFLFVWWILADLTEALE